MATAFGCARPDFRIGSAGTAAEPGRRISGEVCELLSQRLGIDASSHVATQLDRKLIQRASVIVTATRQHRVQVNRLQKGSEARTFTLLELARAADAITTSGRRVGLDQLVAAANKAAATDWRDYDDDLADPYGLEPAAYLRMADTVDDAVRRIAGALNPT